MRSIHASAAVQQPQDPPALSRNRSFWAFLCTESLGAFNDNVFKQVVLLLCVGHMVAGIDFQTTVQFLFALPFLLFSGLAGDIADRFSKSRLMVVFKLCEIAAMLLELGVFLLYDALINQHAGLTLFFWLLAIVTCLMGTHSAFFGPPKYAGVPEPVRKEDLGMATGLTQMTTFFGIVLGFACAGFLVDNYASRLHIPGFFTAAIAVLGTLTALGIAYRPPCDPSRKVNLKSFLGTLPVLAAVMRHDRLLFSVMLIYSWFWLVGGVALTAINNYGLFHLGMSNFETSQLVSIVSVGMAVGSVVVGKLSQGSVRIWLIKPGLIGMVLCLLSLLLIPVYAPSPELIQKLTEARLTGQVDPELPVIPEAALPVRIAAFAVFSLLGGFVGFFTVPLMALVQARPAAEEKGQVFAAFNWLSWLFIVAAAPIYGLGMMLVGHQAHLLLALMGVLTLLVGWWLMPGILRALRQEKPDYISLD